MAVGSQESARLLNEIVGKLDYALRVVQTGPGGAGDAPAADAGASVALIRSVARIVAAPDTPQIIEAVLDAAIQVTQAERAFVMMLEEGRKLRFKAGVGIDQDTVQGEGQTSKTLIKSVIQGGGPTLVGNTQKANPTSTSMQGMNRSIACVPIRTPSRDGEEPAKTQGILYLDSRITFRELGETELGLATTVADIAACVLDARRGGGGGGAPSVDAGAAAKIKHNMERLIDVSRAIGTVLVLDDLLQLLVEKVLEVTKSDRCFLMLLEEGKPVFKIGRAWNKQEGARKKFYKLDESQFFFSRTITRRALEEGQSICIKDTVGGVEEASVSIVQMELQSVMCTPLRESGNTLGLIYVDSKAAAREFDQGDLELFEALAGQAAIGIKNALLVARVKDTARLESEIQIAAQMQQDMCPRVIPRIDGLELAGTMVPAKEVGGDYYDFVEDSAEPGKTLSIVVGDVSGKGLGSGIVAVMARCFLRSMMTAYGVESPSSLLGYLNLILTKELKPGMFMTMLLLVWDAQQKVVRYAAAGHEHIIVWRGRQKTAEAIQSGGRPLGLSATTGPTPDAQVALAPGDALILYSDGVTEAMNENHEEFELERVLDVVKRNGTRPAATIIEELAKEVAAFRGAAEQSDDITLVALRRTA